MVCFLPSVPPACYVSLFRRYERKMLPRLQILSMTFKKNYVASMSIDLQSVPIKKNREKKESSPRTIISGLVYRLTTMWSFPFHSLNRRYYSRTSIIRRLSDTSIIRHLDCPAQQINDIHYIFGVH